MNKDSEERNLVIDRFEGGYAVCEEIETKNIFNYKAELLPEHAKEGDVIAYENGVIRICKDKTEDRVERISRKLNKLWE